MYSGAGIFVGFLKVSESCQRYSNLRVEMLVALLHEKGEKAFFYSSVAFISGQLCGEQNSVMEP